VVVAQIDPKKLRRKQTVNISVSLRAFTGFILGGKNLKGEDVSNVLVSGWRNC